MSDRQHAIVTVPDLGSFPAVVDMDAEHATATLLVRPLHPLDAAVGRDIQIDVPTKRGLLHLGAHLVQAPTGELLELDLTGQSELVQRRGLMRVDAFLEVAVTPPEGGAPIPAAVVNISGSGAVVSRLSATAVGDAAHLDLRLAPHDPPLAIDARVVRVFDDQFRAVHFELINEADRERIIRFVFDRQRLARRDGRL
jgi:PilZ domain